MRSPATLLAALALVLAVVGALVLVPLWIPVALLALAFLVRDGLIRL
jgi:hypothetical protein